MRNKAHLTPVQDFDMDHKILAAFERVSQALRTLAWQTGKAFSLNPVQMQILIFLLTHEKKRNSVSALAREFNVSKASISDTVTSLVQKNLVDKKCSQEDSRSFIIQLTIRGKETAQKVSHFAEQVTRPVSKLFPEEKSKLFSALENILFDLNRGGVVPVLRMCKTCKYYENTGGNHFCKLMKCSMDTGQLQLDCREHMDSL